MTMTKNNSKPNLNSSLLIVCALRPEAKPFIAEYKLKQVVSEYGFHLLTNQDLGISLLITGHGKVKTAAAIMWASTQYAFSAYLNIGIIGHGTAAIGTGLLVNKVVDCATQEPYYPMRVFKSTLPATELTTVDEPSNSYEKNMGYDMEASAFLQVARLFVSVEMVQSYKVVSDNLSSSFEKVTANLVNDILAENIENITEIIQKIKQSEQKTSQVLSEETETRIANTIVEMQKKWHITANQFIQLEQSLQMQQVLKVHTNEAPPQWHVFESVKAYLYAIKQWRETVSPLICSSYRESV